MNQIRRPLKVCIVITITFQSISINAHAEFDNPVSVQIVFENMTRDGITVILEWTQDNHTSYSYDVSITPHAVSTLIPERMRVQLNVSYNLTYNVSVLATPNCGNNITAAASIELYYYGDEYTGSNGEWEPDPNTQSTVNFKNESIRNGLLSRDGKIAVASSVTVFTVASISFFIVGFLCGHFCQKKRKSSTAAGEAVHIPPEGSGGAAASEAVPQSPTGSGQMQIPFYDDVVHVLQQEEVELKENVAYNYGPLP